MISRFFVFILVMKHGNPVGSNVRMESARWWSGNGWTTVREVKSLVSVPMAHRITNGTLSETSCYTYSRIMYSKTCCVVNRTTVGVTKHVHKKKKNKLTLACFVATIPVLAMSCLIYLYIYICVCDVLHYHDAMTHRWEVTKEPSATEQHEKRFSDRWWTGTNGHRWGEKDLTVETRNKAIKVEKEDQDELKRSHVSLYALDA